MGRTVYLYNPYGANLSLFARYIDYVIIIWDGPEQKFLEFAEYSNNNIFEIKFTSIIDKDKLVFLDSELSHDNTVKIVHRTHFKPTSGNLYVFLMFLMTSQGLDT